MIRWLMFAAITLGLPACSNRESESAKQDPTVLSAGVVGVNSVVRAQPVVWTDASGAVVPVLSVSFASHESTSLLVADAYGYIWNANAGTGVITPATQVTNLYFSGAHCTETAYVPISNLPPSRVTFTFVGAKRVYAAPDSVTPQGVKFQSFSQTGSAGCSPAAGFQPAAIDVASLVALAVPASIFTPPIRPAFAQR
jgi:hypothetical protein